MPEQAITDHDLLIELRIEMRGVRGDIRDMKDGVSENLLDHEQRLRTLESRDNQFLGKQSLVGGAIGVAATIAGHVLANWWPR